jgi:hypothetical protein
MKILVGAALGACAGVVLIAGMWAVALASVYLSEMLDISDKAAVGLVGIVVVLALAGAMIAWGTL